MYKILSLLDFFFSYYQIKLDKKSRNITTFIMPIGLFYQYSILIGIINLVAQFIQCIVRLFYDLILHIYCPFLDNIAVKGSDLDYSSEEVLDLPKIRKFIADYIKNLNNTLFNTKLARAVINAIKLEQYKYQANIVGYIYSILR